MSVCKTARYHLPGLFEFYELYKLFLPLYREHREFFYDWCEIGSIYGAPADCIWGGGRVGYGDDEPQEVLALMQEYGVSSRLTFSNSLLTDKHLSDKRCNALCKLFNVASPVRNGVVIYSDVLLEHVKANYQNLYFVASTTKVITDFDGFKAELENPDYDYVVPDFRLNKSFDGLTALPQGLKDKTEFLCNECCPISCTERKRCYMSVSAQNLGIKDPEHICPYGALGGYSFSRAMLGQAFIGIDDIQNVYLPLGFTNFKLEGRSLGSAMVLEFLLYYMTKPEYQLRVREAIYLSSSLDLF